MSLPLESLQIHLLVLASLLFAARVPADVLVARVATGMDVKKVAEEYGIGEADVYNALNYAAIRLAEEQIWITE